MVNKTEIRIGNLLWPDAPVQGYFFVSEIIEDAVNLENTFIKKFSEVEPVPITSEFLRQAGFVYGRKFCGSDFYDLKLKRDFLGNEAWEFRRNNKELRDMQYIHQVQNLYYAISGEELRFASLYYSNLK